MKRKNVAIIVFIVLLFIGVMFYIVLKLNGTGETEPEYVFFYAENQTSDYPTTLGGLEFARLVEEKTAGRIKIIVADNAEFGSESEVIDQISYGGIAFARISLSTLAEIIPQMNVLQLPYLYNDSNHMWRVLDGEIGDSFLAMTLEYDLVGLSWYDAGARNFYSTVKPITCLEDFAGMKIRVQESDMMADMVEALGAIAVKTSYAEVYSSLEQGIVDGAENNWPSYETMKHYEVAPYYTVDEHTRVPEMQICSKYVWDELSEEDRDIIKECAKESAIYERELWKKREDDSKQIAIDNGVQVYEMPTEERKRLRDAMEDVYYKYCSDYADVINEILKE
jgi:tripartite ATP-independent transporter DctP family solute receptor